MDLKKFLLKLTLLAVAFCGVYYFFVDKLSKGYVDPYYYKFTQEAGGLILGLSRANEGISPYIVESKLDSFIRQNRPIVNLGINEAHFGDVYLETIKKKIKKSDNGLFIISVSPANFTAPKRLDENQIFDFDKKLKMGKITNFTSYPNHNYIINTYGLPLYSSFHNLDQWNHRVSHKNGWNEIILKTKSDTITDNLINYWKTESIKFYTKKAESEHIAPYRYDCFIKTLKYLTTKGHVFLTRVPSDLDVVEIENSHWQTFDKDMDSIAKVFNIPYLNYSKQSNEYKTYDGSHLESESAKKFTRVLCDDIKNILIQNKNSYL
ncbi:hypothetical protein L3X39_09080 [Sabulilitoribacter multivorans]|uniref:SGNH/GDSL hydrolase family protein n=1 Tax=Flaviramulus multivorans TaxID=1304750 RepID=A0ABS9IJL6_9FLAO|nr:hypothetical protein [Flaviramulus multivorans]MCF7560790.1 hypothetical protein [Flaviramulus multivorans]